jgi:hypothetical protein
MPVRERNNPSASRESRKNARRGGIMNAGLIQLLYGLTALIVLCPNGYAPAYAGGRQDLVVTYVSPAPNSSYILPGSNIIVRTDHMIGPDASLKLVRSITGSRSGTHRFAVRTSDDGRTVICKPAAPFAPSENVSVQVDTTAALWSGTAAAGGFSFSTSGTPQTLAAIRRLTRAADFPALDLPGAVSVQKHAAKRVLATAGPDTILPNISVTVSGATAPGDIFLAPITSSADPVPALLIMRNDGSAVFARDLQADAYDFKPQPNGMLTYYDNTISMFVVMDKAFNLIDTLQCGNNYLTDIHELRILPNRHALLLGTDIQTVDMSQIVPGGNPQAQVVGSVIQELDTSKDVVFQWRTWDHFKITDALGVDFTAPSIDYVHSNAIDVDTDGNLLLSSRMQDEITKINRETGDVIWRLGGKNNQFRFVNDSIGFSYQHAVRRIANGDITLLDNGDLHVPPFSRAVEYALDTSKMTATLVWQYRHTPDVLGFAMGYVERMDNGNTFIAWGAANPTVTEVTPAGTVVYEMTLDPGVWTYRAFRYVWPPAVTSAPRGGTPAQYALAQNYPNPFNPATTIQFSIAQRSPVRLEVFTMLGQRVATLADGERPAGNYSVRFDGSHLASGVYFYRLQAGDFVQTRKLVLLH